MVCCVGVGVGVVPVSVSVPYGLCCPIVLFFLLSFHFSFFSHLSLSPSFPLSFPLSSFLYVCHRTTRHFRRFGSQAEQKKRFGCMGMGDGGGGGFDPYCVT